MISTVIFDLDGALVETEEFLVIEDSPAGVGAAVAAGMRAVTTKLIREGVRAAGLLGPRWVVEEPGALRDVVRRRIEDAGGRRE